MRPRWLVTGGAGFIGSNLVRALLERGEAVRVADDFSTGRRSNLEELRGRDGFSVVEGDLAERAVAARAVEGIEVVLHQAAIPSVPRSITDPVATDRSIVGATVAVLDAARRAGVRRVVYASSSSVYGDSPVLPKHEGMTPAPISPYAVAKLSGELYCGLFGAHLGVETVALRYFNVFGPRQDPNSEYAAVIPRFIARLLRGERPTIFGDGLQTRDFCFVQNAVEANLLAASAPAAAGQVMNVASGERVTLLELCEALNELCGTRIAPELGAARRGDILHSLASIDRARELLGYAPRFDLRAGLAQTVAWFRGPGAADLAARGSA